MNSLSLYLLNYLMKNKTSKNLLIISAHADDHISCAGTIFKLRKEFNFTPYEVVFTNSELGQDYRIKTEIDSKEVAQTRSQELAKASKFLGIAKSFCLDQPDLGLEYSQDLIFKLVKIIREVKPEIVFLHNQHDDHPDHKMAYLLGIAAIKAAAMSVKKETLGAPFRTPVVLCNEGMLPTKTQILVDVTNYAPQKDELIEIYESQANPRAIAFEKCLATVRGYQLKKEKGFLAENFTLQEEFPILLFEN
jgi:LmbE family N-acetylglucosaminyl deacetylase